MLVGELQPFFNWQSSISRQIRYVFSMRVHERALNDAINYAQKGCAMQMWGMTLNATTQRDIQGATLRRACKSKTTALNNTTPTPCMSRDVCLFIHSNPGGLKRRRLKIGCPQSLNGNSTTQGDLGQFLLRYVPLASQNPYPIIVYSVANYRPHLSHFWANNVIFTIPT